MNRRHLMYTFSARSHAKILNLEPDLYRVVRRAMDLQVMDFTVLCSLRTPEEQIAHVREGRSRTLKSRHLPNAEGLAEAVDLAPFPVDWNNTMAFHRLAGVMFAAASLEGVALRWGGDWDRDGDTRDQSFIDLPHFELARPVFS